MTDAEIRCLGGEIAAYLREVREADKIKGPTPIPDEFAQEDVKPEALEAARDHYTEQLMAKPAGELTQAEQRWLATQISAVLRQEST